MTLGDKAKSCSQRNSRIKGNLVCRTNVGESSSKVSWAVKGTGEEEYSFRLTILMSALQGRPDRKHDQMSKTYFLTGSCKLLLIWLLACIISKSSWIKTWSHKTFCCSQQIEKTQKQEAKIPSILCRQPKQFVLDSEYLCIQIQSEFKEKQIMYICRTENQKLPDVAFFKKNKTNKHRNWIS